MDVVSFLDKLCDNLAACGTTSRQLAALEFAADGRDINVRSCEERGGSYPDLDTIVAHIGPALSMQDVTVGQLRRITFLDGAIQLEHVDADGRVRVRSWSILVSHRLRDGVCSSSE